MNAEIQPFSGLTVLDCTHVLAGPYATYQFALLGADVIKIESPDDPDCARGRGPARASATAGLGLNYRVQGGNKRAIALDLASADGREAFLRLVDRADILVENYRPGALARLDLAPAVLIQRNPALIICSISGFGQQDDRGAYDNVIQAASGLMMRTGSPEHPVKTGASVFDYFTGMSAAFAISAALRQREQTGHGQWIDCAMLDCAMAAMAPEIAAVRYSGPDRAATGAEPGLATYATAAGKLTLGAFTPKEHRRLWTLLEVQEFADVRDWDDLWSKADAMRASLTRILATRPAAEWEVALNAAGVPAQRVRSFTEAATADHPHFLVQQGNATVPLTPFRLGDGAARLHRAAPAIGQDSDAILTEIGLSDRIAAMRANGSIL